jgi:CHAT domain-containing protein
LGQCPLKESLWKKLIFLRDSSTLSTKDQLHELLNCEAELNKCTGPRDSVFALLQQRIAVAYYKMANYEQAETSIGLAIDAISANSGKPFVNAKHLVRNYYILSLILNSSNRPNEKMQAEDSCISISLRMGTGDLFVLSVILARVEYLLNVGDYHSCISYAKEGEMIVTKSNPGRDSLSYQMYFFIWRINAVIRLKEFDEAEKLLTLKIEEFRKANSDYYLGTLYERLAAVKIQESNFSDALHYFNLALAFDNKNRLFASCMLTAVNKGFYLYNKNSLNDKVKAIQCYIQALHFGSLVLSHASAYDSQRVTSESFNIYVNIANTYAMVRLYDSAQFFFKKGFSLLKTGFREEDILDSANNKFLKGKTKYYVINALLDRAEAYLSQYQVSHNSDCLNKAARIYPIAEQLQYRIKTEQIDWNSQLFWRSILRRLYEHAIETYELIGNTGQALYYFEKSRAVLLNDEIDKQLLLDQHDIWNLAQIKKKILQLNRESGTPDQSSARYAEIQNALFTNNRELNRLDKLIKNHNPLYNQRIQDTSGIYLADIQKNILKDHDAMLELFNGDSAVYSLMITPHNSYLNKINKQDFDSTANLFLAYISNQDLLNREFPGYTRTASHLYKLIFENNPVPNGRVVVSPDGHYFPFEALVTNNLPASPIYFINDHAVSYTYSARYLLNNFATDASSGYGKNFLGVAPVQYPPAFSLAELPGSDGSLKKIANYFSNSNNLITEQATKNNFLQNFFKYKIIQLYTHSSDTSINAEPVIYFADSALYLSELIPENRPVSKLIVLSACETGNGKLYRGEGVFSFNRGFAALGIPASITNLWSVDNEATYEITELFYKYLAAGIPLDIALQKAKLEFIGSGSRKKTLPYYWAATIIAGRTNAINLGAGSHWPLFIRILGSLCIIISLFWFLKYRALAK